MLFGLYQIKHVALVAISKWQCRDEEREGNMLPIKGGGGRCLKKNNTQNM